MIRCRKCGHGTWTEYYDGAWWFRCICGGMFLAERYDGRVRIAHTPEPKLVLPTTGTALSRCLGTLATYGIYTTAQLARKLKQDTDTTTAQLGMLRARGLVLKLNNKQGLKGGSSWTLTDKCLLLFQ